MSTINKTQIVRAVVETLILLCLAAMFLAGNDIWHDTGSPEFWHLGKPRFADVRVFVCAYYVLVALVLGRIVVSLGRLVVGRKQDKTVELRSKTSEL